MAERTRYSVSNIDISRVSSASEYAGFSCGNKELDNFFHQDAIKCVLNKFISLYKATDVTTGRVVALFSLANDSVFTTNKKDKQDFIDESMPQFDASYYAILERQASFPAINIAHLGVDSKVQSKGIGTFLINYIQDTFVNYPVAGCQFITVDALNTPDVNKFYDRVGFVYLTDSDSTKQTRRMFMPLHFYQDIKHK